MMLRWFLYFFLVGFTACQMGTPEDEFPEFTEEQLNQMLKASPEYHKAMREKARYEQKEELIDSLKAIYVQDSTQADAAYDLAFQYCVHCISDGQYCEDGIKLFSKVIETNPNYKDKKAYYNRMLCYKQLEQFDAALKDLDIFIAHYKDAPILNHYAMRAELLYLNGDSTQACDNVVKAYRLDSLPFDSLAWHTSCLVQ